MDRSTLQWRGRDGVVSGPEWLHGLQHSPEWNVNRWELIEGLNYVEPGLGPLLILRSVL